jgi:SLT domain-containing protein
MAPAMAAQAAVAAGALGAPAIPAAAVSAGRQYGGPVAANGMYRINETGAPEILNLANGRQYMLPNARGEVVSNRDATAQAGSASRDSGGVTINLGGIHISSTWPLPDSEVRDLVGRINDALKDGMVLRAK